MYRAHGPSSFMEAQNATPSVRVAQYISIERYDPTRWRGSGKKNGNAKE
jgi:hypothetical protein